VADRVVEEDGTMPPLQLVLERFLMRGVVGEGNAGDGHAVLKITRCMRTSAQALGHRSPKRAFPESSPWTTLRCHRKLCFAI